MKLDKGEGIASIKDELESMTDTIVWGDIQTRKGNTALEGVVSCVADASVQFVSVETGEILIQRNISNIRGFGNNEPKACSVALQKIGDEISKAIVERLDKLK